MKNNTLISLNRTKRVLMGLVLAMAVIDAQAIPTPVNLGAAADFAVLAGSGITVTGSTTITGVLERRPRRPSPALAMSP